MRDSKADSRKYFDKLAPRNDRHYYGQHGLKQYELVVDVAAALASRSFLDIGCGTGGLLARMSCPKLKLAGADLSAAMIKQAGKRLGKLADLKVADSESLPWKAASFDLVVTTDSFHHWPHPLQALREAGRVLKRGGHIVLADVWAPSFLTFTAIVVHAKVNR